MKTFFCSFILFSSLCLVTCTQHVQKYKGYPSSNPDLFTEFVTPPKGYGNVPFYWWNGDSLDRDRMKEQLDILSEAAIDGFAVSYLHLDPRVDTLQMKDGYGLYGKTEPGRPEVFSEEWWDVWSWFAEECARKNIGLGMDDYTVGWIGNGYYPDEVRAQETFRGYQGELEIISETVKGGTTFEHELPNNLVSAVAWPGKIDLTGSISGGKLSWNAPAGENYSVYIISTKESHLLHPNIGNEYVKHYFDRFEKRMRDAATNGMNYFFQDELHYPIKIGSWSEDFQTEFEKRKGYDITLYLPALVDNIGESTPKIRLDYSDVLMDLAEERYLAPIYEWNAIRTTLPLSSGR